MLKLLLKLAVVAALANAALRVGSAYLQFYRFRDATLEAAQYGGDKPVAELRKRVIALASQYDVPLSDEALKIQRTDLRHTIIDGSYEEPVDLFPGYTRPWPFTVHVDVFTIPGATVKRLFSVVTHFFTKTRWERLFHQIH